MAIYQPVPLYIDVSAAQTTTPWYRMLAVATNHDRAIHGTVTSGDSVVIQFTNERLVPEKNIMSTEVSTNNYAFSDAQTSAPFSTSYKGSFIWVRAVKTGSNGAARIVVEC